jgi:hypothetical protein
LASGERGPVVADHVSVAADGTDAIGAACAADPTIRADPALVPAADVAVATDAAPRTIGAAPAIFVVEKRQFGAGGAAVRTHRTDAVLGVGTGDAPVAAEAARVAAHLSSVAAETADGRRCSSVVGESDSEHEPERQRNEAWHRVHSDASG